MKCPSCWSKKAYRRQSSGWRNALLGWLVVPLKCQHCYHKFSLLWPRTWGQQLDPPSLKLRLYEPSRASYAAQNQDGEGQDGQEQTPRRRAA